MTAGHAVWARLAPLTVAIVSVVSCGRGGSSAGDDQATPAIPVRPRAGAVRSRAWIDANPLSETQQRLLDDCLEDAIGRRDLGGASGPSPSDLAAYETCGAQQGVLDRIRTVDDVGPIDPSEANRELAAEAACLVDKGWRAEEEPPDERGIVFWNFPSLDPDAADQLNRWNADRRACGTDVPDPPRRGGP